HERPSSLLRALRRPTLSPYTTLLRSYERHYQEKAAELSALRANAAERLAAAVEQEMQALGMPGGRFSIQLQAISSAEPHANGLEDRKSTRLNSSQVKNYNAAFCVQQN